MSPRKGDKMLNVKAAPCEKSKAIVLVYKRYANLNDNVVDKVREGNWYFLNLALEVFGSVAGLHRRQLSYFSAFRKSNPKRWYRFLKFCKQDGRIKVYRKNGKMVYEVPTYFEE